MFMKNTKRGFTLIELLVVVLIVGILAAVAVPQYQRAVRRSRMAEIWSTMGSLRQALAVKMLEGPETTTAGISNWNPANLDASINCSQGYTTNVCWVTCPVAEFSVCWYEAGGSPTNPTVYFHAGTNYNEGTFHLVLDKNGRYCQETSGQSISWCKELGFN